MNEHDRFAHDDAAYVLGALSDEESTAFEAHLATCMLCQDAVAELSDMPAMLAGLTEADFADTPGSRPPDTLLPSLLRAARRQRARRRWAGATAAGLAAAAIVALSVALVAPDSSGGPKQLAMTALVSSPVRATAQVQDVGWGTRITLDCTYRSAYAPDVSYQLVIHDKHGAATSGGSWQLNPGRTTHFVGGTALHRGDIASIDIVAGATPILTLRL